MKRIKYVLVGALAFALSAPVFAQEVSYQEALKPIEAALQANPNSSEAKELIKNYTKTYKKDADALVGLGTVYLQFHQFDKAQAMADLVTSNKKFNQSSAYVLRGDIAAVQDSVGNAGAAAAEYQTAISIDQQNVKAYERYARVYRHVNSQLAVAKLEELRKIKPDYPLEVTAGDILLGDGKYKDAADWYAKADASKLNESGFYNYAVASFYSGNYSKALEVVDNGLQKFNKSEYLSRLGMMAAVEAGNFPKALDYATNVLNGKEKKSATDYYYYGQALAGAQKYQEAIDAYNKSLELDPKNTEPLSKLAIAYNGLGDQKTALEYSQKYLNEGKNVTSGDWSNLANIYTKMGDDAKDAAEKKANYEKAMDIYEQMTAKFPSMKDWCWASEASIAMGKLKDMDKVNSLYEQIVAFEEAKGTHDANIDNYLKAAYYFLGYYASQKKNVTKATDYFTKLLAIDPTNEVAKQYIEDAKAYESSNAAKEATEK